MDKNSVIGLVLIGALLVGYSFYTNKQQQEYEKAQAEWIAAHPELAEPTEVVDTTAVVAETATIAGDTLTAEQRQQLTAAGITKLEEIMPAAEGKWYKAFHPP